MYAIRSYYAGIRISAGAAQVFQRSRCHPQGDRHFRARHRGIQDQRRDQPRSGQNTADGSNGERIEQGSDVRLQTKKIADKFIKPVESGNQMQAPSRVLFQWGSFEFIGMVQTYDETLV